MRTRSINGMSQSPNTQKSLWKSNLYFAMEAPLLLQEPQNTNFFREAALESKKLWKIAGPVIFTAICQYSLGAITQTFVGHVGTLELAAVSVENSVVAGFAYGLMVKFTRVLMSPTIRNHLLLLLCC